MRHYPTIPLVAVAQYSTGVKSRLKPPGVFGELDLKIGVQLLQNLSTDQKRWRESVLVAPT